MLNWQPKISLEEGIKILLDNIDYWKEAPVWTPDSIAKATEKWFDLLVKKFAKYKVLSVILEEYVPPNKLAQIGELVDYNFPKAVIRVTRSASNIAAAQLLQQFPVDDLNIEEPDIEDIIRDVFTGAGKDR